MSAVVHFQRESLGRITSSEFVLSMFRKLCCVAQKEARIGRCLDAYRGDDGHFNPRINDSELYYLVALLYLARFFGHDKNRVREFLKRDDCLVTGAELLDLVAAATPLESCSSAMLKEMREMIDKVFESKFFSRHIAENDCSPVLKYLREQLKNLDGEDAEQASKGEKYLAQEHLQELERTILTIYKYTYLGPYRWDPETSVWGIDEDFFDRPSDDEWDRLLQAARDNPFFYDLISLKPPNCRYNLHEEVKFLPVEKQQLELKMPLQMPVGRARALL
ncbi:hypothetical protein SELMODRAFT_416938 [Selaginella moellendorffii]|uniref:Uncharacterized protein n=1 Tax=Selaginella moellendorffii TaxID=88036 RepID=D8S0V5_SELML|nr:hypothetical protein SELMODRAFT_416938 [Selaginella moellendorffii]